MSAELSVMKLQSTSLTDVSRYKDKFDEMRNEWGVTVGVNSKPSDFNNAQNKQFGVENKFIDFNIGKENWKITDACVDMDGDGSIDLQAFWYDEAQTYLNQLQVFNNEQDTIETFFMDPKTTSPDHRRLDCKDSYLIENYNSKAEGGNETSYYQRVRSSLKQDWNKDEKGLLTRTEQDYDNDGNPDKIVNYNPDGKTIENEITITENDITTVFYDENGKMRDVDQFSKKDYSHYKVKYGDDGKEFAAQYIDSNGNITYVIIDENNQQIEVSEREYNDKCGIENPPLSFSEKASQWLHSFFG